MWNFIPEQFCVSLSTGGSLVIGSPEDTDYIMPVVQLSTDPRQFKNRLILLTIIRTMNIYKNGNNEGLQPGD